MHDILIKDALLVTGDGAAPFAGSLAIENGRIAALGKGVGGPARVELDAGGKAVCPGFIDLHTHALHATLENYVRQGATLLVTGNCGFQPATTAELADKMRAEPVAQNLATFAGHNAIRMAVMGRENRPPTAHEMRAMKAKVAEEMYAGAVGFSTGLAYVPGAYSKTEEVAELAAAAAPFGGFYATHMRGEGADVLDSMEEALRVGREGGLPVHLSHHKVLGKANWGRSAETLALLDKAREGGMDVTADQYPYTASCGTIQLLLPEWAGEGDADAIIARLRDPARRKEIKRETVRRMIEVWGGEPAAVMISSCLKEPSIEGMTLDEVSKRRGRGEGAEDAAETAMEIVERDPNHRGCMCVYHSISEDDVCAIMQKPYVAVGSDGWNAEPGVGKPHPRSYGTFPRVLGRYCREKGLFPLEEAVRKMTGLPAARLRLADRGVLREGAWADVTVFDPETVQDRATFQEPHQYPEGIETVIVNGQIVLRDGHLTGAKPGAFVARPGA